MDQEMSLSKLLFLPYTGKYTASFDNKARIILPIEIRRVIKQRYELIDLDYKVSTVYFRSTSEGIEVYDNPVLVFLQNMGEISYEDFFPACLDSNNRINIGTQNAQKLSLLEKEADIIGKGNYFFITKEP